MIRLFKIEFAKIKTYKPFWIIMGLYTLFMTLVMSVLDKFNFSSNSDSNGESMQLDLSALNFDIYDFPMIWHVVAYTGSWWLIFPAILIIVLITDEINFKTLRQQLITGMSRFEILSAKLILILSLSVFCTAILGIIGLVMGLTKGSGGTAEIFGNMDFMLAAFIQSFRVMVLCLLLGLFIKRTGFAIVLFLLYTFIIGPLLSWQIENQLLDLLIPLHPTWAMIENPLKKLGGMFGMEAQEKVDLINMAASVGHTIFDIGLTYLILLKRDL